MSRVRRLWARAPPMAQYFSIRGGTLNSMAKPTAGMADQNASLASSQSRSIIPCLP
ncbi:hypothetical protein D3C79_907570 [compost metagenome]